MDEWMGTRPYPQHLQRWGPMFVINVLLSGLTASEGGTHERAPQQLADLPASISTGVKSISEEGQRPPECTLASFNPHPSGQASASPHRTAGETFSGVEVFGYTSSLCGVFAAVTRACCSSESKTDQKEPRSRSSHCCLVHQAPPHPPST